ncbi:MAG: CDP-alcohol phosphatidyltransferase family protein [Actinomycetes bacterium]
MLAIIDASRTSSAAKSVQRLRAQLNAVGVMDVVVACDDDVEVALRSSKPLGDDAVVVSGDIVVHLRALRAFVAANGARLLVSRRPMEDANRVRVEQDRVVSCGSAYHSVTNPNAWSLAIAVVPGPKRQRVADELMTWRSLGTPPSSPASIVAVALVRRTGGARAIDIRELMWRRAWNDDETSTAEAEFAAADEETLAMHSAVKAEDEAFTTFLVSPYSRYIARWCAHRGIRPNAVTLASIGLGFVAAAGFAVGSRGALIAGAVLLQVSFMLDCVDGQLARFTSTFSTFGAWLDITFDRAKEYAVYAGLAVGAGRSGLGNFWPWALAALVIRVSRHLVDFSFIARPTTDLLPAAPAITEAGDGLPASRDRGAVARTSRRMDASSVMRWVRKMAVLPFGQRLALISLTTAIADARVTFYALVPWAGVAGVYATTGRVLRSLAR